MSHALHFSLATTEGERESVKLLPDYSIGLGAKTTEIEACMVISCSVSYLNYTMTNHEGRLEIMLCG